MRAANASAASSHRPKVPRVDWPQVLADAVSKPGVVSQAYALFHRYSTGNQLLALWQCLLREVEPGPIHTYAGWQKLGRQVKKGERALVLVMPVAAKAKRHEQVPAGGMAEVTTDACASPDVTYTRFVERPFWFVLSQTEGEAYVPEPIPEWDEARALATLDVERVRFTHSDGNCQGYASGRRVAVSPIAFHPHRTLLHELAHVELGHTEELQDPFVDKGERTPKDLREVEAECVALLCMASLGLPGEEFSRGYVQHWLGEKPIPERSVHRIFRAADAILRAGREEEVTDADSEGSRLFA